MVVEGDERRALTEVSQVSLPRSNGDGHRERLMVRLLPKVGRREGTALALEPLRRVPDESDSRVEPARKADGTDDAPCTGGRDSASGGEYGWLSDVRAAVGVEQFRNVDSGPYEGATPSGRNAYGRQVVALHDGGIPSSWEVFEDGSTSRLVDSYVWGCRQFHESVTSCDWEFKILGETICIGRMDYTISWEETGWFQEMPEVGDGHGVSMAGIIASRGREDGSVNAEDHTGMVSRAGLVVLGPDAVNPCGTGTWERFTGPQMVEKAAEIGADVIVSASSVYIRCPDAAGAGLCGTVACTGAESDTAECNSWATDMMGTAGLEYATAIDDAFAGNDLLTLLSAGNNGGYTSGARLTCGSGDKVAMGLGRASHTAIPVGAAYTQSGCSSGSAFSTQPALVASMTDMERATELQGIEYWLTFGCSNSVGPTGDGRFYPLLLGYSGACGVPVEQSWCGDTLSSSEAYSSFGGSSAAVATVGGAATALKEWLEATFGVEDGGNPAMLRVHLLNMGDRTGAWPGNYATTGLVRHTGFGKLRLRIPEDCQFNDGMLDYRSWRFENVDEVHTIGLSDGTLHPILGGLPADLSRIRICVWFELNTADISTPTDRPFAFAYLQRATSISVMTGSAVWETVDVTWTGQEFVASSSAAMTTSTAPHVCDPHMSIALDNEWRPGSVEGGYQYRLSVWVITLPQGPVTVHASILWETGNDPSLARNRGSWRCVQDIQPGPGPASRITEVHVHPDWGSPYA